MDEFQTALDIGGMIPVFGEAIDGVNAIIYYARGDKVNAALAAGSMIPYVGNGVAGAKLINKADNVVDTVRSSDEVADIAEGMGNLSTIYPNDIRFSQSSVNGAKELAVSMKSNGWVGDPIDVVKNTTGWDGE